MGVESDEWLFRSDNVKMNADNTSKVMPREDKQGRKWKKVPRPHGV